MRQFTQIDEFRDKIPYSIQHQREKKKGGGVLYIYTYICIFIYL